MQKISKIEYLFFPPIVSMLIIGQVNEFTPFKETGNIRLFPPPMMQMFQHAKVLANEKHFLRNPP